MKKIILIGILVGFVIGMFALNVMAKEPTGKSKICDDIGYLSTKCLNADVLPMEYKDKEVAIEKAKQKVHNENKTTKNYYITKEDDGIIIKTYFEED